MVAHMSTKRFPSPRPVPHTASVDFTSPRLARLLSLSRIPVDPLDFIKVTESFNYRQLEAFLGETQFPKQRTLDALDLASSTVRKFRKAPTAALPPPVRERISRLARVTARAEVVFEDAAKARRWLWTEIRGLGMRRPIDLLSTDAGTEIVLQTLGRIEYGVYS